MASGNRLDKQRGPCFDDEALQSLADLSLADVVIRVMENYLRISFLPKRPESSLEIDMPILQMWVLCTEKAEGKDCRRGGRCGKEAS